MARRKKPDGKRVNYLITGDRFKKLQRFAKAKQKDMTQVIEALIDSLEVSDADISQ